MLKQNPMVKRIFEVGEEQLGRVAQQLLANEMFVNAVQNVVGNTLKAKGLLDKNIRVALSAMNLPSVEDLASLKRKLDELEATLQRLEKSVERLAEQRSPHQG